MLSDMADIGPWTLVNKVVMTLMFVCFPPGNTSYLLCLSLSSYTDQWYVDISVLGAH